MLSIAHGTTGAFITTKIPYPAVSIPLAIAAHFLEDYIVHWDVGQGLTKKTKSKRAAFIEELVWDLPLSILLVYIFFQHGKPFDYRPWLGWFLGLLPDFLEFPYLFLNWRFFPMAQLAKIHAAFHRSTPEKLRGLAPQIILILVLFLFR